MLPGQRAEIRSLTGLRGVAALYVVGFHYVASRTFTGNPVNNFLVHGYLSVDLFFVLSGFVMALSYRHMFASGITGRAYGKFLGRRLARVYPLYFAATVTAFVLAYTGAIAFRHSRSLWTMLGDNLLMVQAWGVDWSLDFPGWSISAEWAAYLLFPLLLAPAFSRRGGRAWLAGCVALLTVALLCAVPISDIHREPAAALLNFADPTFGIPAVRCVAEFTLGLLAFRLSQTSAGETLAFRCWPAVAVCACLGLLLCVPGTDLGVVALLPLLMVSLAAGNQLPARLLATPAFEFLGRISYSVYLVHGLFAPMVNRVAERLTTRGVGHAQTFGALLGVLATGLTATLAYRTLELPGRHWVRRLFEGERAERPPAPMADRRPEPGEF